jgi:1,4-dihydroxy-2-naphthoate octaprenyltransferase
MLNFRPMKNLIILLRIPFSLFLMPVYLFALGQAQHPDQNKAIWIFIILHLLIYPASNAFNSYFDKDEGPIGGVQNPPPVTKTLYYLAQGLDFLSFILALVFVDTPFALAILVYSLISKAYSHPSIRLKQYPFLSWLVVGVFQGYFIYLSIIQSLDQIPFLQILQYNLQIPALLSSLNLMAFYPMTQIYQHKEDASRNDLTLSRVLGIRGTFYFTASIFFLSTLGYYFYFDTKTIQHLSIFLIYLTITTPSVLFFTIWYIQVHKNETKANFINTMILNLLGSLCLNLFFLILIFLK